MKKISLSILFGIISILSIYASSDIEYPVIDLTCNYNDSDNVIINKRPRTPECSPRVYQNENTLIFETTGFCHSVILIDINTDEVVYETIITGSTTQISLPAYLEGEYEIRFNSDRYYYYGNIEL